MKRSSRIAANFAVKYQTSNNTQINIRRDFGKKSFLEDILIEFITTSLNNDELEKLK